MRSVILISVVPPFYIPLIFYNLSINPIPDVLLFMVHLHDQQLSNDWELSRNGPGSEECRLQSQHRGLSWARWMRDIGIDREAVGGWEEGVRYPCEYFQSFSDILVHAVDHRGLIVRVTMLAHCAIAFHFFRSILEVEPFTVSLSDKHTHTGRGYLAESHAFPSTSTHPT